MKTEATFTADFVLEGKAAVHDGDNGFFIEGYATDFGVDRQNEAFEPGAFDAGMKSFMGSNPILLFHHHYDQALGNVVDYRHDKKGMWVKAWVDNGEPGTHLADVASKVKSGIIKGFSLGGKFYRHQTAAGRRIHTADIAELSVTPLPINARSLVEVSRKAFGDNDDSDLTALAERLESVRQDLAGMEARAGE